MYGENIGRSKNWILRFTNYEFMGHPSMVSGIIPAVIGLNVIPPLPL
jgi:hypothetical protein